MSTTKVAVAASVCILAVVAYMTFKPTKPQSAPPVGETEPAPVIATADPAPDDTRANPVPDDSVTVNTVPEDAEVVVSATFDDDDLGEVVANINDMGLAWSVENGTARLTGTTSDTVWLGDKLRDKLRLPLGIDARTNIEISVDFKIVKSNGQCLIAMWSSNGLTMVCRGTPPNGRYVIDRRWMKYPTTLEGNEIIPAFGDEMTKFHKMRILIDRSKHQISYYVDDVLLGDVHYNEETEFLPLEYINVEHQTPYQGTEIEIHFDNLKARSFGPIY